MMRQIVSIIWLLSVAVLAEAQEIRKLFEEVNDAVVVINVKEKEAVSTSQGTQLVTAGGLGSGVVVSEDGLILTASHVVQTAESLKVKFTNGEEIPAKVESSIVSADVALIRLVWKPKELKVAKIGNSDEVRVGDQIMVIGSPYGLEHSLSVGYISHRHKGTKLAGGTNFTEFFQTDAAINKGNSGGPMFNMKGEVVGIVSYILSESGGFQGLGFAASSNIASGLLDGHHHFWTGMESTYIEGDMARILNVPQGHGILIQKVASLSPVAIMGLQGGSYKMTIEGNELLIGGDIITSVNEIRITSQDSLDEIATSIRAMEKGDVLHVTYLRAGREETASFQLMR